MNQWTTEVTTTISDNTTGGYWNYQYPYKEWFPIKEEPFVDITAIPYTSGYLRCDENIENTEVFEMQVYDVIVIDTKECEVVQNCYKIVAENEKMAMLELQLDENVKKAHKKGQIAFIFNHLGGFNRYTRKVQIKDED